jgi:hypothetical protein
VWIRAKNSAGTSGFSASASATPAAAVVPSPPAAPGKPAFIEIVSHNTKASSTGNSGTIKISWESVSGATGYDVYYAPRTGAAPSIPSTAATGVSTVTSGNTITATITAGGIGDSTMNYYVWVKAKNEHGSSPASAPVSTLDWFLGVWGAAMYMSDYYHYTNTQYSYVLFPDFYFVTGKIRALRYFEETSVPGGTQGTQNGPCGVVIYEIDPDEMATSGWMWAGEPNVFGANYFCGLQGAGGSGSRGVMGNASNLENPGDGVEVGSVDAALTKFNYAGMAEGRYYSLAVDMTYIWSADAP